MRVLKTRGFERFAKSEGITDVQLVAAIKAAERGLIDADLGGGIIKLRIARPGKGKSGGFRTLIAYKVKARCVSLRICKKCAREYCAQRVRDFEVGSGGHSSEH